MSAHTAFETGQPWVIYHYGRTHDLWWPFWNSTRMLGRACIVCECAVCGARAPLWIRVPRFGPVPDQGHHPKRSAFLATHAHPDRGAPMSWKRPLLNPAAHTGGIDLESLAMRLEADMRDPSILRALSKNEIDTRTGGLHPAELCGEDCSGCCDEWEWK